MRLLRRGSTGADVKAVQRALNIEPDGIFGTITYANVRAFQRRRGLEDDGIVGPKTRAVLFPKAMRPKRVRRSSSGSPRGRVLAWLEARLGWTEDPPGSNRDRRSDGITAAQMLVAGGGTWLVGLAWCGVWCAAAAIAAGLKIPEPYRWASVARIEDDARVGRNGFRGWVGRTGARHVQAGDLAVLFGRGVHVETVVSVDLIRGLVRTRGGNTGPGNAGSQSNGGGAFERVRSLRDVHGFALVHY